MTRPAIQGPEASIFQPLACFTTGKKEGLIIHLDDVPVGDPP
jgi:hypothetical protein